MVYKKYIIVHGKRYGPYLYHSRKKDGKVISEYCGKPLSRKLVDEKNPRRSLKLKFVFLELFLLFLLFFFFFNAVPSVFSIAGNSSNYTTDNKFDLVAFGNASTSNNNVSQRFVGGQQMIGVYNNTTTVSGRFGLADLDPSRAVAATLSANFSDGIVFVVSSLPQTNLSAQGNNNTGVTLYSVAISAQGTLADLYIRADGNLTSGANSIPLANEKYSVHMTNASVPSPSKFSLTTNFSDNLLASNISDGSTVYLKFFLNVSGSQAAGTYTNFVFFKVVPSGETP